MRTSEVMTETLYKLTDAHLRTRRGFTYVIGVPAHATGFGARLCTDGVLHAYRTPLQAAFMAPAHVGDHLTHLWRAEGVVVADDGTKVGVKALTLIERAPLPTLDTEKRVQIAIAIAWPLTRSGDPWRVWAYNWLTGQDRTYATAASAPAAFTADASGFTATADAAAAGAAAAEAYAAGAGAAAAHAAEAAASGGAATCATLDQVCAETCAQTAARLEAQ